MILILSGGLDSIAAWRLLDMPPAVHFQLGTRSREREYEAIIWAQNRFNDGPISEWTTAQFRPFPMADFEAENGYLPFRNALLILAAAQLDNTVVIGQVSEWAPDKNLRFYRRLERAVNISGRVAEFNGNLRIEAPFAGWSKGRLLFEYARRFGLYEAELLLAQTWSCYGDGRLHCGRCGGCRQRFHAEVHFARLMDAALNRFIGAYEVLPTFELTPLSDQLRWLRDNGFSGVQQILARRSQNKSARLFHRTNATARPPFSLRFPH